MKISEVNIHFVKPQNGLIAFASFVIGESFYVSSVAIHQKLSGGYRLTYPTKKSFSDQRPLFHPINHETQKMIESAILNRLKDVMRKSHDRYGCFDSEC